MAVIALPSPEKSCVTSTQIVEVIAVETREKNEQGFYENKITIWTKEGYFIAELDEFFGGINNLVKMNQTESLYRDLLQMKSWERERKEEQQNLSQNKELQKMLDENPSLKKAFEIAEKNGYRLIKK